jgi:putative DNA primase/helicase
MKRDANAILKSEGRDVLRGMIDRNRMKAVPNTDELVSRRAADIKPEKVRWLWPGRLAKGKHTCIAGEPGTGKSQLSMHIAAVISTAGEWPCDEGRAPLGNVIVLSAEDGAADTIIPRLIAAGADLNRVHIVSAVRADRKHRSLNLMQDLALLESKIKEIGDVALIIIDPVSSYLGKTDSHKNAEVRGVLEPLSDMADRTGIAILSITHFSKGGSNTTNKALHRFIGSIAFTGAPRAAFVVIDDAENEGRKLFLHAKNNLAAPPQGLAFRLEQTIIEEDIVASRVWFEGSPVTITANQAMAADAAGADGRSAKAEAKEFLEAALAAAPVPAKEIESMAREHGITAKVLRTAREELKVKIDRDGFGKGSKSLWSLPNVPHILALDPHTCPPNPIDAQQYNWASMEPKGKYGAQTGNEPGADSICGACGKPGSETHPLLPMPEDGPGVIHEWCVEDWQAGQPSDGPDLEWEALCCTAAERREGGDRADDFDPAALGFLGSIQGAKQ